MQQEYKETAVEQKLLRGQVWDNFLSKNKGDGKLLINCAYQKPKNEVYKTHWWNSNDANGWQDVCDEGMNINGDLQARK